MPSKPETQFFVKELRPVLERAQILIENMHGGMYQVGIPDKLLILPVRNFRQPHLKEKYPTGAPSEFVMVEMKYCQSRRAPSVASELVNYLEGRQKQLVMKWALRGAPVFVVCGSEQHPNEVTWVNARQIVQCTKDDKTKTTFGTIVNFTKEVLLGNLGVEYNSQSW